MRRVTHFPRLCVMSKSPRTTQTALLRCRHGLPAYTQPPSPSFHLHLVSRNSSSIVPAVANYQTLCRRNTGDPSSSGHGVLLFSDALWQICAFFFFFLQRLKTPSCPQHPQRPCGIGHTWQYLVKSVFVFCAVWRSDHGWRYWAMHGDAEIISDQSRFYSGTKSANIN